MMMIPKWGNYPGDGGGGITLVIDNHERVNQTPFMMALRCSTKLGAHSLAPLNQIRRCDVKYNHLVIRFGPHIS